MPLRWNIIAGMKCPVTATKDHAFRSIIRSQDSRLNAWVGSPISKPPATWTSTSTAPKASRMAAATGAMAVSDVTSAAWSSMPPWSGSGWANTVCRCCRSRSIRASRAPSAAKRLATARPSAPAAPVITT
ncbi:hypothetical protein D3C85_1233940 [compost metagenome]